MGAVTCGRCLEGQHYRCKSRASCACSTCSAPKTAQKVRRSSQSYYEPKTIEGSIRAWARREGLEVSRRGRVSRSVIRAYAEAHPALGIEVPEDKPVYRPSRVQSIVSCRLSDCHHFWQCDGTARRFCSDEHSQTYRRDSRRRNPAKGESMPAAKKTVTIADVRSWAQENGHTVGARGRIAASIIEAFNVANRRNKYVPPVQ